MSTHAPPLRLLFAGTPEFAAAALAALLASRHGVAAVYTQPDRPAGRGRRPRPSAVKQLAERHGLPVEQPESLRDPEVQARLRAWQADAMVVAAYGLILPRAVLEAPRLGCVNIHASLLPRWRGAAPIQRAILAGDRETGISIMQMDAGLDTGPVLQEVPVAIGPLDTAGSLHDRLATAGAEAVVRTLDALAAGTARATPQDERRATYAAKIERGEARLDWSRPAAELERQVRAFNPWPVAFTALGERTLRVWESQALETPTEAPGTVLAVRREGIDVGCGAGMLRLRRVQLAGGKPLDVASLVNGHPELFSAGMRLDPTADD